MNFDQKMEEKYGGAVIELIHDAEENQKQIQERDSTVLKNLSAAARNEYIETIDVYGQQLEIQLSMNNNQINKLREIENKRQQLENVENPSVEQQEKAISQISELLGTMIRDEGTEKQDWMKLWQNNQLGLFHFYEIVQKVWNKIEENEERIEKFRQ